MLEATVEKAAVVQDKMGKLFLLGVAAYLDDRVNFKLQYDMRTLDIQGFVSELRETLARDFDIPVYKVDLQHNRLLKLMAEQQEFFQGQLQ